MNEIEPDAVEAALDEIGAAWKRRDGGCWIIPASARVPCEIEVVTLGGGLHVESVLATWGETLGETESKALTALLTRAEADLPGAYFLMREGRAVVAVDAFSERQLPAAISRIVLAARLLGREAAAVLERDMADRYLAFFAPGAETAGSPARI